MSTRDRLATVLREVIDRRAEARDDIRPRRVMGRNPDGTLRLVRVGAECEERGGLSGAATGQIVHLPRDTHRDYGAAGFSVTEGSSGLIWVEAQDPFLLEPDATQEVTITGRGLVPGMVWIYLLPDSEDPDPEITVDAAVFVDDTEYTLTVTTSAEVAPREAAGIAWEI